MCEKSAAYVKILLMSPSTSKVFVEIEWESLNLSDVLSSWSAEEACTC